MHEELDRYAEKLSKALYLGNRHLPLVVQNLCNRALGPYRPQLLLLHPLSDSRKANASAWLANGTNSATLSYS